MSQRHDTQREEASSDCANMPDRKTGQNNQGQNGACQKINKRMTVMRRISQPNGINRRNILTALTDAWEQCNAMSTDAPNTFTQAKLNGKHG